ncbi:DUF1127 domain-containing protein [Sinorhizobium sojae]|uniref:DUF1127 domain-containing protein n=1 Tax=Sinorhizobium sojae TaxID=716925 RepID=UPI0005525182|nr:DUF1127 domain-containing protein [Sinorhizobium sojae]
MGTIDAIQLSHKRNAGIADTASNSKPGPVGALLRLWRAYSALASKRRSRLALGELSAEQLKDIGLTEAEARREAAVPFWR